METALDPVAQGNFYQKQLACRSRIIAWSHRSRFDLALRLLGPSVTRLLDYGCGDGTFLAFAANRVKEGWGADISGKQVADCRERLASIPNLQFCALPDLEVPSHARAYDVVTCMETLEHCPAEAVEVVLENLVRLVAPGGRVIISVPIETGPTFLLKLAVRKVAAWRGLSEYRDYESYTLGNAARMIFAGPATAITRPLHDESGLPVHSHYGFNWRALRERVRAHLTIERTHFSPLGFMGGWVSSQAWFVCRSRGQDRMGRNSPGPRP